MEIFEDKFLGQFRIREEFAGRFTISSQALNSLCSWRVGLKTSALRSSICKDGFTIPENGLEDVVEFLIALEESGVFKP